MKSMNAPSFFNLIMLISFYLLVVHAKKRDVKNDVSNFEDYILYKNINGIAGCGTPSEEAQEKFTSCINACEYTRNSTKSFSDTETQVMFEGGRTVRYSCFLSCFFSFNIAIYRNAPFQAFHLFGVLERSILCRDNENRVYCHSMNKEDKQQAERFVNFKNCLLNNDMNLKILPEKYSFLLASDRLIREDSLFHDCFFKDPYAIALRKTDKNDFLLFLERDKVPGYEKGTLYQMRRGAM